MRNNLISSPHCRSQIRKCKIRKVVIVLCTRIDKNRKGQARIDKDRQAQTMIDENRRGQTRIDKERRYGNFPKDFSEAATSQGYFPNWQLPKCEISQALVPQPVLAVELGPLARPSRSARPPNCSLRRLRGPNLTFGSFRLGSCHFGGRPWKNAFGKAPNTTRIDKERYKYI